MSTTRKSSFKTATSTVATLAAATVSSQVHGEIITNNSSFSVSPPNPFIVGSNQLTPWDIDGNGSPEAQLVFKQNTSNTLYGIPNVNRFFSFGDGSNKFENGFAMALGAPYVLLNAAVGATIGNGNSFNGSYIFNVMGQGAQPNFGLGAGGNEFTSGTQGFVGFKFNPTGGQDLYGYASVTFTSAPNGSPESAIVSINSWSYDDTGAAITVVPEPSSLALLAMGAGGLAYLGRRKRKNA